ncbi:hypothetical protein CDG79_02365 [Nostoc sp. 'Peltigera membranacea cyanobiont' 232]|nr:hypothetical protein CDG79_02365 [Nostoc sp. 'Peltigera membranacea cyanobiont' 232]
MQKKFAQLQLKSRNTSRIKSNFLIQIALSIIQQAFMDVLELKREIETLSSRLGKTQDYL